MVGRYGWKLAGFSVCESAGIERVEVTANEVHMEGFYPGSFPTGFLGYYAEEKDGTLYVGFKFSILFGIFETGDFDISIPVSGEVRKVIMKSQKNEVQIWPKNDYEPDISAAIESGACESGVYVQLDRKDVYSIGWQCEDKSGGMSNADNTAWYSGTLLYLDSDIAQIAYNLERAVPFILTFSDNMGNTIVQADLVFDPDEPVMVVTVGSEGELSLLRNLIIDGNK